MVNLLNIKSVAKNVPYYLNDNPLGFDTYILDDKKLLYAVFDGMGTSPGARYASEKCAELFGIKTRGGEDWNTLREILTGCMRTMGGHVNAATTATVVSIDSTGTLHYAHAGDSRLYVLSNGRIKQVTADEGVGNMLFNYVGTTMRVCQAGSIAKWDRFMLCTDGITGDWEDELLADDTIEQLLKFHEVGYAAEQLVQLSKKSDDKTLIIVGK